ncbi:MAG: hypothetical protein BGO51_07880 [Rhodospirillales bacterium 69-11]|nr:glycosyltransferase [Rhodospirillales bacterium]OJW24299.1 MAG: hypothetical protein BGO51_07880 [Rhodospirillales bacterium 69-11]
MIAVIEPTYARGDHAAVNAALLHAIAHAFPDEPLDFAATADHRQAVAQVVPLPASVRWSEIAVMAPGGVHASRFHAQWRAMRDLVTRTRPRVLVVLSSGPETFFAVRALAAAHSGLRIFVVLHGNLNDAVGWRSRDPRRRWFDYRAGLRIVRHARIRLVVLEEHIRDAAIRRGLASEAQVHVWPHPLNGSEISNEAGDLRSPLRIAFLGAATRAKGFDTFLAIVAAVRDGTPRVPVAFTCIGPQLESFPEAARLGLSGSAAPLDRAEFLSRLDAVDYVLLPYGMQAYELTASGSLLDCIARAKPVIALDLAGIRDLVRRHGEIGFVRSSPDALATFIASDPALGDATRYRAFQERLRTIARLRTPAALAARLRDDIGPPS